MPRPWLGGAGGGGGQALGSAPWRCLEAGPASAPLQVGSDHLGEPARGGGGGWPPLIALPGSGVTSRVLSPVQPSWEGKAFIHSFARMYY